jgi:hypothetical protein
LVGSETLIRWLRDASAPVESEQIGISPQRVRETFIKARFIRRRFTVLDLDALVHCGTVVS